MFQLVNPKGLSFLASIMTAYISSDDTLLPQLLPIVILLPAMTLLSALTWSLFGTVIGRLLTNARTRRIFNISMAALLVGCIVPIALS
jgi:threonine/homoserine/homoserine lactone efflux protein